MSQTGGLSRRGIPARAKLAENGGRGGGLSRRGGRPGVSLDIVQSIDCTAPACRPGAADLAAAGAVPALRIGAACRRHGVWCRQWPARFWGWGGVSGRPGASFGHAVFGRTVCRRPVSGMHQQRAKVAEEHNHRVRCNRGCDKEPVCRPQDYSGVGFARPISGSFHAKSWRQSGRDLDGSKSALPAASGARYGFGSHVLSHLRGINTAYGRLVC